MVHRRIRRLVAFGRGILALDTAPAELAARFRAVALIPSARLGGQYLATLLAAPGLAGTASGVVLTPGALAGRADPAESLRAEGILVGVRADRGAEPLSLDGPDRVTAGLDGLATRLAGWHDRGATFAVWSTVAGAPTDPGAMRVLTANGHAAARFAALCHDLGMVPIIRVGTRVGVASGRHRSATVAAALLSVCGQLQDFEVDLSAVVICTEIEACPGGDPLTGGPLAALPAGLGAVALTGPWLGSGTAAEAIEPLRTGDPPWPVTFYAGRPITEPALREWGGRTTSAAAAQHVLHAGMAAAADALRGIGGPGGSSRRPTAPTPLRPR